MEKEDIDYIPSNREKAKTPKRGVLWRFGCDCCIVGDWHKCPVCGTRNNTKTYKYSKSQNCKGQK